jgi:hypothetical protein
LNLLVEVPHLLLVGIGLSNLPLGAFIFPVGVFPGGAFVFPLGFVHLLHRRSL